MSKLIQRRESTRYPGLFVKKYTRRVFFDGLWNEDPELLESRGHVEDTSGNIVIRPFTKIFNHHENGTDIDRDERVLAIEKINGFMAAATYVPAVGEVVVSTTGSLDSPFVGYAEQYLQGLVKQRIREHYEDTKTPTTFMFEICHPDDPHIIPEREGAYLIGARIVSKVAPYFATPMTESVLDNMGRDMKVMRPGWTVSEFSNVVKQAKECKHEGFVVYGQTSRTALKIKSPYYLTLKACARKKDIMSMDKQRVDEEFYGLLDHLTANSEMFNQLDEQGRLQYVTDWLIKQQNS